MKNFKKFSFMTLISIALSACDGGSSSNSSYRTPKSETSQNNNAGYNQEDADFLRSSGISPSEARAAEKACGRACQ